MPLKPITGSTALAGYHYDPKTQKLEVQFTSGGVYHYADVPKKVVQSILRAKSKGKMFHKKIKKGGYEYEKVSMHKHANDPIKVKYDVQGVPIHIEWKKGETRLYKDHKTGEVKYKRLMKAHYGYIPNTKDADGEELDVYLGDDHTSPKAFVIKQLKKKDRSFDENKVMVGYPTMEAAKASYMHHMSACPECFGGIHEVPVKSLIALFGENGDGKEKVLKKAAAAVKLALEHRDKLPGGAADNAKPKDFDQRTLAKGSKHEQEHTKDKSIAKEIAMDHLSEDPKYYKKLERIEKVAAPNAMLFGFATELFRIAK